MTPRDRYLDATQDWAAARAAEDRAARQRAYALADWRAQGTPVHVIARETGLSIKRIEQMIERARTETR